MRIVLDLQGAQSESRVRGIGRYSLSLALAIARNAGDHEIVIALNGLLLDAVDSIRAAFDGVVPSLCADLDGGLGWRVLRGVLEEVHEDLLHEDGVERNEREVGGERRDDFAAGERLLASRQGCADHLFEGVPSAAHAKGARFEPRHVEEVLDEAIETDRRAIQLDPESFVARWSLGIALGMA